ncbi:MAG: hypothetical protein RL329_3416 [Bacteroidota bacterium]|jgi:hypothetical protein
MSKPVIADKIHLNQVDILKARIDETVTARAHDGRDFSSNLVFQMRLVLEQEIVFIDLEVIVDMLNGQTSIANSAFKFSFHFQIEQLSDFIEVNPTGKTFVCDRNLAGTLAAISFSTVRGILLTRFQGTIFKNFILPIVNPEKLLANKLTI